MKDALDKLEFCTVCTDELTDDEITQIGIFFAENYQQANQTYLENSLKSLRKISMALDEARLVGFSLADSVSISIPRMEKKQLVMLGGIGCIDPHYRRLGLFSHLASQLAEGEKQY